LEVGNPAPVEMHDIPLKQRNILRHQLLQAFFYLSDIEIEYGINMKGSRMGSSRWMLITEDL